MAGGSSRENVLMAPDFTLTDQNGNKVSLHDFKGKKNVALAFYIFAFTGG